MSIESVVDVVVHLGNFKTFDMLAQGTYRLQIKVFYRSRSQQKTYAQPYLILDNRFSQNGISQKLFEPTINPKDNSVLTSSFFIRFCDQESLLNQIAMFRMEVNDPKATSQEAFIEMALLSLEIGESKEMKSDKNIETDEEGFQVLTQSTIRVKNVLATMHDYIAVVFSDFMFSYVDCIVHTSIMNLRFKASQFSNHKVQHSTSKLNAEIKPKSLTCFQDMIESRCFSESSNQADLFFNEYPKSLLKHLRDLLMYIEKQVRLLENWSEASVSTLENFASVKEQLLQMPIDFPQFLYEMESLTEGLSPSVYHEKGILELVLENCKVISPKLKETLITASSSLIQTFLFKLLDLSFLSLKSIVADGRDKFHGAVLQKIQQQYVQYTEYCIDDLGYSGENKIGEYHNKLADTQRESLSNGGSPNSQGMTLENLCMFSQPAFAHIVFIEKYTARLNTPPKKIKTESNTSLKTEFSEFMTLTPVPGDKEKLVKEAMVVKPRIIKDLTMSNISMDEDKETKNTDKELVESNSRMKTLEEEEFDHFSDMFTDRVPALEVQVDIPDRSGPPELRISEGSIPESLRPDASKGALHLVVFVHGYEGCSFDMKLIKNMFCFVAKSHLVFHSAIANETDSSEDIGLQGAKLAAEIIDLIKFNFKPEELKGFVGHSLGGLVIRAALPQLKPWKHLMHTFMTFGTPHLGCSNNSSTLIKTGLRIFTKLVGHKSLNQMNLSDTSDLKESFVFKLSSYSGIEWFEHMIVFSSYQDLYVPFESARIEYGDIEIKDKKRSHIFKRMVQNILGRLKNKSLIRIDINFKQQKNLNSMIGRNAHIRILDTLELQAIVAYFFIEYLE